MITWNDTSAPAPVDDPYYYLYYSSKLRPLSYFSLEKEMPEVGRVLRFDSLSKIVAAGIRIGFASGPDPLLRAIDGYVRRSFFVHVVFFCFFVLNLHCRRQRRICRPLPLHKPSFPSYSSIGASKGSRHTASAYRRFTQLSETSLNGR